MNFLLIDNCDFDIILGMDWLSQVYAVINCQRKGVVFQFPNLSEFEFSGKGTIFDQVAYPDVVCMETLATLDASQIETPVVVREFLDVFPEDLPGLPPDREVEFTIDVLPGTAQSPRQILALRLASCHENAAKVAFLWPCHGIRGVPAPLSSYALLLFIFL